MRRVGRAVPPGAALPVEPPGLDRVLADLSTTLVECPTDAIADHVAAVVDWTTRGLDVDHGWLAHRVPRGSSRVRVTLEWARTGCPPLTHFEPETTLSWASAGLSATGPCESGEPGRAAPGGGGGPSVP